MYINASTMKCGGKKLSPCKCNLSIYIKPLDMKYYLKKMLLYSDYFFPYKFDKLVLKGKWKDRQRTEKQWHLYAGHFPNRLWLSSRSKLG